ncbi:hypothetical protein KJ708_09630, partial [bacterium]|nr:hypothetical protein [bacterium]MBU1917964.1 hypothetical protein [bacterium]
GGMKTKKDHMVAEDITKPINKRMLAEIVDANDHLSSVAKSINSIQTQQLKGLMFAEQSTIQQRTIERIYSRQEIKKIVIENLILEYQHDYIIEAVTEYLYSLHVSK